MRAFFRTQLGQVVLALSIVAVLGSAGVTALMLWEPEPADPVLPTSAPVPESDVNARSACRDFRVAMKEVADGVLTDAELRSRLRDVYETARRSDTAGISAGATELLAASTAGNEPRLTDAVRSYDGLCESIGH